MNICSRKKNTDPAKIIVKNSYWLGLNVHSNLAFEHGRNLSIACVTTYDFVKCNYENSVFKVSSPKMLGKPLEIFISWNNDFGE